MLRSEIALYIKIVEVFIKACNSKGIRRKFYGLCYDALLYFIALTGRWDAYGDFLDKHLR